MDLPTIIQDIANRADVFLDGIKNRREARAGINELMTRNFPFLSTEDRKTVGDGVMDRLEADGFLAKLDE